MPVPSSRWTDAQHAAALLAVAGASLGGIVLRCGAGAVRERWLARLKSLWPATSPWRQMPAHIGDERLLGGLDLAATLRCGRPVAQRGLLAEADGGLVVLGMAERRDGVDCARLTGVLDRGEVLLVRDGLSLCSPSRFAVLALDEGIADDEVLPAALADRLAIHLDLGDLARRDANDESPPDAAALDAARARLPDVQASDAAITALCAAAQALGIDSARAPLLALQAARAAAALAGRGEVDQDDLELAARLVLAPRATCLPAPPETADPAQDEPADADTDGDNSRAEAAAAGDTTDDNDEAGDSGSAESVVAAARAALGAGLLARLQSDASRTGRTRTPGRSGAASRSSSRGRPVGVQRGELRSGARLSLIDTLRAAAPWQAQRRDSDRTGQRIAVRPEDIRVTRFVQRRRTTTLFAVDASGSAALHRLAEAKGAVELLLADCYVRRDQVAVLAFRGAAAELLLPATRSFVRARRSLAGLPGGGGTPLAAGLDAALQLAEAAQRRGDTPLAVFLTDGRANIARDGTPDRPRAEQDALQSATRWRGTGLRSLLIDTSARPEPRARALAERMGATYLPLPHAQAGAVSEAVRRVAAASGAAS
jgi:magnesium chelatase subunit D